MPKQYAVTVEPNSSSYNKLFVSSPCGYELSSYPQYILKFNCKAKARRLAVKANQNKSVVDNNHQVVPYPPNKGA